MSGDSGARALVSERSVVDRLPAQVNTVLLDDLAPDGAATLSPTSPGTEPTRRRVRSGDPHGGDNLAYLIYTSGSTGRPKAAAIRHLSAVALLAWARTVFGDDELSGMLASTSICFDLSVFEIFLPLTTGGPVILADNALALSALPAASVVTFINTVPSAIAELTRQNFIPASVRTVALAGEPLTAVLADRCTPSQASRASSTCTDRRRRRRIDLDRAHSGRARRPSAGRSPTRSCTSSTATWNPRSLALSAT